jgi:hypothetical protein
VGAALIAGIADWCRAQHAGCGLHLWVLEQNVGAQRLYERLGARDVGGGVATAPGGGLVRRRRYAWRALPDLSRGIAQPQQAR